MRSNQLQAYPHPWGAVVPPPEWRPVRASASTCARTTRPEGAPGARPPRPLSRATCRGGAGPLSRAGEARP